MNDAPVVTSFDWSVMEDGSTEILLQGYDADGHELTFSIDEDVENGGLEQMEIKNKLKSEKMYNFIDKSNLFYNKIVPEFRSKMNVTFHVEDKEIETKFLEEANNHNLINLKGHRSIGGLRASFYNAVSLEDVEKLIEFMEKFEVSV